MNVLITGCAGFIGFNLTIALLNNRSNNIIGIDRKSWSDNITLQKKHKRLKSFSNFSYFKVDISNFRSLEKILKKRKIDIIIHLAAEAGVRNSIINPKKFLSSNLIGFFNILEIAKNNDIKNFYYASSSSVYGDSSSYPTKEGFNTDFPLSFYGATKKSNEVIAYSYSHLFDINTIGLRFFTVYGPYGRTDMAIHNFFKNILSNKEIKLNNNGNHIRDYTYVQDVVDDIIKLISKKNKKNDKYKIYNIGGGSKTSLLELIKKIEHITKKRANIKKTKFQKGDVLMTYCDNKKIMKFINKKKYTNINTGLKKFNDWFKDFY